MTEAETSTLKETIEHIQTVRTLLTLVIVELQHRANVHDETKLWPEEFDEFSKLQGSIKGLTYGSVEYREALEKLRPTLEHHYKHNRHHPQHFVEGIAGMNLIDAIEMLCDWLAATKRHADGDIHKSLEINKKRFGYESNEILCKLFENTIAHILDTGNKLAVSEIVLGKECSAILNP